MKLTFILILLIFAVRSVYSQADSKSQFYIVPPNEIIEKGITLNEKEKMILFNKEFTSALSDASVNSIGNYASVDLGATKASFATSFVRKGSVFGFNVSGSTTNGTLKFINNNKLSYNFEFGFQYHFIDASKKIRFNLDVEKLDLRRYKRKKIINDANKNIKNIKDGSVLNNLIMQKTALEKKITAINEKIENIDHLSLLTVGTLPISIEKEILKLKLKELDAIKENYKNYVLHLSNPTDISNPFLINKNKELKKIENCYTDDCILKKINIENDIEQRKFTIHKLKFEIEYKALEKKIKDFEIKTERSELDIAKTKLEKQLENLNEEIKYQSNSVLFLETIERSKKEEALQALDDSSILIYGSSFNWFSVGFKTNLKSFTLFNSTLSWDKQLNDKESVNAELLLQYSWHQNNELLNWKSYLINLGLAITYGDNIHLLSPKTIEDETLIVSDASSIRTTKKQINVYVGDFNEDIAGAKLFTDIYYYLFNKNFAAIHLYPSATFTQHQKPLFKTELGLVLSFKDKKNRVL
ncbi:MAG: hypothetical protein ACKVIG_09200 [Flavobacteriales bacterium]